MKREIGTGERKRDRSGRERTTEEERHGGREKDTKRDSGGREREAATEKEERQG